MRPAFCFAYGSGVKRQDGYDDAALKKTLIDLIVCVDDAEKFHTENVRVNPTHYSGIKAFGPSALACIQENFGARVYCNTLIPLADGSAMKYGVISTKHLITDLDEWTHLYVAGRLHKPVQVIADTNNEQLKLAIQTNYRNAIRVALLMLPNQFKRFDLFHTIANLSYAGDFRMIFGEKKDKVKNIVQPQLNEFYEIYRPYMREVKWCLHLGNEDLPARQILRQDKSPLAMRRLLSQLPMQLNRHFFLEEFMELREDGERRLAFDPQLPQLISAAVRKIVWRSSAWQSLKNIPTAGVAKSVRYSWAKAMKTFDKWFDVAIVIGFIELLCIHDRRRIKFMKF